MEWSIRDNAVPTKVLLRVSKFDHCLGDLLYRYRIGELNMDVVGIASNHPREAMMAAPEFGPRTIYANLGRAAGQDDDEALAIIWNPAD